MLENDRHGPWLLFVGRFPTDRETEEDLHLDDDELTKREGPLGFPVNSSAEVGIKVGTEGRGPWDIAGWKSGVRLIAQIVNTSLQDKMLVSELMRPVRSVMRSV